MDKDVSISTITDIAQLHSWGWACRCSNFLDLLSLSPQENMELITTEEDALLTINRRN